MIKLKRLLPILLIALLWPGVSFSGYEEFIAHWDGNDWSRSGAFSSVPDEDLNAVHCISTSDCWLVGDEDDTNGTIAHWTGSTWTTSGFTNNTPSEDLNDVFCVSSTDCWAVGDSGKIVRYASGTWSQNTDVGSDDLDGIHCVAADDCWAVGEDRTFVKWNGSGWTTQSATVSTLPVEDYNEVDCFATDNCIAVADDISGELIVNWDGNNWTRATASPLPSEDLNAIDILDDDVIPGQTSFWNEIFH